MTTSRQHQEAHGSGQIEEQLNAQAQAAEQIQGLNEADREVIATANREHASTLDEVIDT